MRARIKAQTVCRWRQGEVEVRFKIYDPGTEDKVRLDARGGDSRRRSERFGPGRWERIFTVDETRGKTLQRSAWPAIPQHGLHAPALGVVMPIQDN